MRQTTAKVELQKKLAATKKPGVAALVTPDVKLMDALVSSSNLLMADTTIVTTKDASGQRTIKMFESQDDQRAGVSNVAQGRLEKNLNVMVGSLVLLAAVSTIAIGGNPETLASLNYGSIAAIPGIGNGELTIRHKGKVIVDRLSLQRFINSDNERSNPTGELVLDNPFSLAPQELIEALIEFNVDLPKVGGFRNYDVALKLVFCGTGTIPA